MKTALITGITGQDGSFLAEHLLELGYRVVGFARKNSWFGNNLASHLGPKIEVMFGDMSEGVDLASAVQKVRPDEIYNLASQSRPSESWSRPSETLIINGLGAIRLFEAVRSHVPDACVYQASSSEMLRPQPYPQDDAAPLVATNPYAAAKIYAHQMANLYRESYGLRISCGILFNHESERRPLYYVTQKIAYGAACAHLGIRTSPDRNEIGQPLVQGGKLGLGNLAVARDWGYAGDFVKAMHLMLQCDEPSDFVIGSGKLHTLQELCDAAYGVVDHDWREEIYSDVALTRPLDADSRLADISKARRVLGWEPTISFEDLLKRMVLHQIKRLEGYKA